jgi:hypothetical protein
MLSKGPNLRATKIGPKRIAIEAERHYGAPELTIGVLEGLAMTFDVMPSLDVEIDLKRRGTFIVYWT